jgi:hypothetical protein
LLSFHFISLRQDCLPLLRRCCRHYCHCRQRHAAIFAIIDAIISLLILMPLLPFSFDTLLFHFSHYFRRFIIAIASFRRAMLRHCLRHFFDDTPLFRCRAAITLISLSPHADAFHADYFARRFHDFHDAHAMLRVLRARERATRNAGDSAARAARRKCTRRAERANKPRGVRAAQAKRARARRA